MILSAPGDHVDRSEEPTGERMRTRLFVGSCNADAHPSAVWLEEISQANGASRRRAQTLRVIERNGSLDVARSEGEWTVGVQRDVETRVTTGGCREVPREAP